MYNTYNEIIWLTNLLNTVDKRAEIRKTFLINMVNLSKKKQLKTEELLKAVENY